VARRGDAPSAAWALRQIEVEPESPEAITGWLLVAHALDDLRRLLRRVEQVAGALGVKL
jgi:hypothetical protein